MPRRLPSPALVVASLALAVALGGTTYAATALPKNSVGAKQLKSGSVGTVKLAKGSVTSRQIKDHTIVAADLAKNAYPALPGKVASAGHADTAGRADALPGSITPLWHVYFDSAKGVAPRTDANDLPADIVGNAQIYSLSNYYRENYSISQVREQLFHGVDPVYPPDDLSGRVELVSYRPIEEPGGLTGSRVVANINLADDGSAKWLTVDGSVLFDDRTGRIFALTMECTSQCYLQNRSMADQIAASWKVNKK